MAILVDNFSRVLVQGITGREGTFHTGRMLAAGGFDPAPPNLRLAPTHSRQRLTRP